MAPLRALPEIELRTPTAEDEFLFLSAARMSAELHGPWYTAPGTSEEFHAYLDRCSSPTHEGFLIFEPGGGLAGSVTISNIVRRNFNSAYLGYAAFVPHAGKGLMSAGLQAVIGEAFRGLALHRLEANVQPGNTASIALVERLGFRLEGRSPRYLHIGGEWRDHDRYAITAEEWPGDDG
jgi:ribosomal-protein-alanine N-acetyltransferase